MPAKQQTSARGRQQRRVGAVPAAVVEGELRISRDASKPATLPPFPETAHVITTGTDKPGEVAPVPATEAKSLDIEAEIAATAARMEKLRRLQRLQADIDKVAERIAEDTARLDSLKAEAATLSAEI
jgi:hypothetical protein